MRREGDRDRRSSCLKGLPLYLAIFLDLFGFGMIFPDIQFRAERMGAPGWLIGVALASTFLVQFISSPLWGRVSDRVGRKPILLICTLLSAGGLVLYGFSESIALLMLSRIVSGLGGANVAVAQALVADMSSEEERTAAMGRMGAAISLGLILGPVFGGIVSESSSLLVGVLAGAGSGLGALLIILFVPAAKPAEPGAGQTRVLFNFSLLIDLPRVCSLAIVATVAWFSLATLEGTFGRLIKQTMALGQLEFGIVFGYESLLGFAVQALLLGWIARRVGDTKLLRLAYLLQGLGLGLSPFTYLFPIPAAWLFVLLGFSTLFAIGQGLANPTINSLCSKLTPAERQGELFGLLQGTRSVGFIVGPIVGGALFDAWFAGPYLLAGATCLVAALLVPGESQTGPT